MSKFILRLFFLPGIAIICAWIMSLSFSEWFRPPDSILNKYAEQTDQDLLKDVPLEDLAKRYDESYRKVKAYESNKANPLLFIYEESFTEPYKSEINLKTEIQNRENESRQVSKILYTGW